MGGLGKAADLTQSREPDGVGLTLVVVSEIGDQHTGATELAGTEDRQVHGFDIAVRRVVVVEVALQGDSGGRAILCLVYQHRYGPALLGDAIVF